MKMVGASRQRGAFLIIMAVLIVVLLGFAALILDVGRVLVLRAEMQNAVDSAALAAARELNNRPGAWARARNAARNALELNSHFARVAELLNADTIPDEAFTFYCIISSKYDPPAASAEHYCGAGTSEVEPGKYSPSGDVDQRDQRSHYVRVTMDPDIGEEDNFTVDLIFYPLLQIMGLTDDVDSLALSATAVAGRNFFVCDYPPLAICDPFEGSGGFKENMELGGHIILKEQTPGWSPGNSGFLQLSSPGASSTAQYLANENETGCSPAIVTTEPGGITGQGKSAINTRFGIYKRTGNTGDDVFGKEYDPVVGNEFSMGNADDYPAAPNVTGFFAADPAAQDYFLDQTTQSDSRFGQGDWRCQDYWNDNHPGGAQPPPTGCTNPAAGVKTGINRWDVFNYEIANELPTHTQEDGTTVTAEDTESSGQFADRRRLFVAVLSCDTLGISGKSTVTIFPPDGFAEIFITSPATAPPNAEIYGEYFGWGDEDDDNIHFEVQLFE